MHNWLRFSGLLEGMVAAGMLLCTHVVMDMPISTALVVLGGAGTWSVYLLDRVAGFSPEDKQAHPERTDWIAAQRRELAVVGVALVLLVLVLLPQLKWLTIFVGALVVIVALLYVLPVGSAGRLKQFGSAKVVVVAFAWGAGAVLLPVMEAGQEVSWAVVLFSAYRSGFVVPNVWLSSWMDRKGDRAVGIDVFGSGWSSRHVWQRARLFMVGAILMGTVLALFVDSIYAWLDVAGVAGILWWSLQNEGSAGEPGALQMDLWMLWPWAPVLIRAVAVFV